MKVSISYPPLPSKKGTPLLSQNRQFQWFNNPTYIYPVIPAYAASMLKRSGHDVFWDDAIAQGLDDQTWFQRLKIEKPDLIAIESKTPVIKRHWEIVGRIKKEADWAPRVVLFGDHVTALPMESMERSGVDFVVTGGDYDFILADLCNELSAATGNLPKGVWYRDGGDIRNTGPGAVYDLKTLPVIDRELTQWRLYSFRNGNFKYPPGTYTMAGRDCWWGRCSFCSWTTLYPGRTYRRVSVENHLDEIGQLIGKFRVREVFDDSGCFPGGEWLRSFCEGVIDRGYHKETHFGCNMRVGALNAEEFSLMRKANFRFVLMGIESVVQSTLNRLNKGIRVEQITQTLAMARRAGLSPHVTLMMGYPWETKKNAESTIGFVKDMFHRGYIETLQATIVVPYPGTKMFEEAKKNGWLLTEDWDAYDMKQSVWRSSVTNHDVHRFTRDLYKSALSPRFVAKKLISVRNMDDVKFLFRAGKKLLGHIGDFKPKDA